MKIQVLDCTLRDGGYVNNWRFGKKNALHIVDLVSQSGVDYVELGFIRLCDYDKDVIQFSEMSQVSRMFRPSSLKLGVMVEIGYGYPVESFPIRSDMTVDLVRIVVWKRMMKEAYEYASKLIEKGYEVCIQATRIEQYSLGEFAEFVRFFSQLNLKGIYIVDTFGLLTKERLLSYASVADDNLCGNSCIGYHAHNNMQQAFSNMTAFVEHSWNHQIMIDASVLGIGRGAGNLCLELLEDYLNEHFNTKYAVEFLLAAADQYILPIYRNKPWGYSMPYLLSAKNDINPSFVNYMMDKGVSVCQMLQMFRAMKERNAGIIYDEKMCDDLINELFAS